MQKIETNRPNANQILRNLRLRDANANYGPLSLTRSEDGDKIQKIARDIYEGRLSSRNLLISTGFGLDKKLQVPLRLPAITIPGLNIMEKFKEQGLPIPKYVLYQATNFIAKTNALDEEEALNAGMRMEAYLKAYIRKFHEELLDHVIFNFGIELGQEAEKAANDLIQELKDKESEKKTVSDSMDKIRAFGRAKGRSPADAELYAAVNMVFSGGSRAYYPFSPKNSAEEVILPLGGETEKPFFFLTTELEGSDGRTIIPLITPICRRPSYYSFSELGDPTSIAEFIAAPDNSSVSNTIRQDVLALRREGLNKDSLEEIYPT